MRIRLVAVVAILNMLAVVPSAYAQSKDDPRPPRDKTMKRTMLPRAGPADPCRQYGLGFARIEGTDTCVKIGGSIGIGGSVNSNTMSR